MNKTQRALLFGIPYWIPNSIPLEEAIELKKLIKPTIMTQNEDLDAQKEHEGFEEMFGIPEDPNQQTLFSDEPFGNHSTMTLGEPPQQSNDHEGLRYNKGKNRLDLIPAFAREQLGNVLTKGAQKYDERNWEKGMAWSNPIASLERHLNAFKGGEDYDPQTGEFHVSHIMANAMFLVQYYKIYPQGDDRPHNYLNVPKIGLDVDEVLCDWLGAWRKRFQIEQIPQFWNFSYHISKQFKQLEEAGELEEFYLGLQPILKSHDLPFEPHCYITSRSISANLTKKWLLKNKFPAKPLYSVGLGESKVEAAQKAEIDIFVDDSFENFRELNKAGICTFLMDRPHNRKYDVGYKRIHSLDELFDPTLRKK